MLFPANSRYVDIATTKLVLPDGTEIAYLMRRFVPPSERFALLQRYRVTEGDRLDNLAARFFGDPEQFWRLCDANGAMRPDALTEEVGRILRVTLPDGIPGGKVV